MMKNNLIYFFLLFFNITAIFSNELSHLDQYLEKHCLECHDSDVQKGDVNLEDFGAYSDLDALYQVYDQSVLESMPPEDEPQPEFTERSKFIDKLEEMLTAKGVNRKLEPGYGNYIDHESLFNDQHPTQIAEKRLWRIDPSAFAELANQLIGFQVYRPARQGVTKENPSFSYRTPPHAFKDFASVNTFGDTTTELLLSYAKEISQNIIDYHTSKKDQKIKLGKEGLIKQTYSRIYHSDILEYELKSLMNFDLHSALTVLILKVDTIFRVESDMNHTQLARTLGYTLSENGPDDQLYDDLKLKELSDILDERIQTKDFNHRLVRFMREFFEYDKAADVFKDPIDLPTEPSRRSSQYKPHFYIEDADFFCLRIIREDKNVIKELLTSNLYSINGGLDRTHIKYNKRSAMNFYRYGYHGYYGLGEEDLKPWRDDYFVKNRNGILHHPAWLVSFSDNEKNQIIQRGRWVNMKLLGGFVPDAPVAVDAQLPVDPHLTLREKMNVTTEKNCWACHKNMDEYGFPFEQFDFIAQYRNQELLRPIVTNSVLTIPVKGKTKKYEIKDPYQFVELLANSQRVQEVFMRHLFRFFMGRNERLSDSQTIIAMNTAYESEGSLKSAVKSLLLSNTYTQRRL